MKYLNSTHWRSYFLIRSVSSTTSQYWVAASDNARVDMVLSSSKFLFNCSRTVEANWETRFLNRVAGHKYKISRYQPAYIKRNISQFIHSTFYHTAVKFLSIDKSFVKTRITRIWVDFRSRIITLFHEEERKIIDKLIKWFKDKRFYVPQFTFAFYTNFNDVNYRDKPAKPIPDTHWFSSHKDMFQRSNKNKPGLFIWTNQHTQQII